MTWLPAREVYRRRFSDMLRAPTDRLHYAHACALSMTVNAAPGSPTAAGAYLDDTHTPTRPIRV
jgi:hypothetical protein